MTNLLRTVVAAANRFRKAHMADSGTYSRGAASVTLLGTPGQTRLETLQPSGLTTAVTLRDWLFDASELILNGSLTIPAKGDRWTVVISGVTEVYEVHTPTGLDQCYHADPTGGQLRVHMKRVT